MAKCGGVLTCLHDLVTEDGQMLTCLHDLILTYLNDLILTCLHDLVAEDGGMFPRFEDEASGAFDSLSRQLQRRRTWKTHFNAAVCSIMIINDN